jgi:hypothetical protein
MRCSAYAGCRIGRFMRLIMSHLQYLIGLCDCHFIAYLSQYVVPTPQKRDHQACKPRASGFHPRFEAWEMDSRVALLQHVVIVRLYTLHLDSTVDIFVLVMHR